MKGMKREKLDEFAIANGKGVFESGKGKPLLSSQ
jgi:hypothetical protein